MRDFEFDRSSPGGGRASSGGSFYHAAFRSGSRASGVCAGSAFDYIAREGEYDGPELDGAVYVESGNMPSWAEEDPHAFWDAADLHERANGRLFVGGDFALPRELSSEDQVELARDIVDSLTREENLPYSFAIHAGHDAAGIEHNPHVHVMVSERRNDGIERSPSDLFSRANREHPERGGAMKSREFHGREWVERAREKIADLTNRKLERLGRTERVDHRSYERQGVDRQPGEHFGPSASHVLERGGTHDRLEFAADLRDLPQAIAELDRRIENLEWTRDSVARGDDEERSYTSPSGHSWGDRSWSR